mmetsp:Transcript_42499/g.79608  ORF Transcript_42499/g.79608 Transcript_42499/m.79608 type:complete len:1441 (-) Transcript_42499:261-4583(-)
MRASLGCLLMVVLAAEDLALLGWSEAYFAEASTDPSTLFTDGVLDKRGWEPCVDDVQRLRCWRMFPRASIEGGCLSSVNVSLGGPAAAKDRVMTGGKRATVVLERNGWYSQDLVNSLAAVILQERMGYEVVLQEYGDMNAARSIIHNGQSHAVLEYWGMSRDLPESSASHLNTPYPSVSESWIGYKGESGIYTNAYEFFPRQDSQIHSYYDYYNEYTREDVVRSFMDNGVEPVPATEEYLPSACQHNRSVCGEVALASMSWADVIWSSALLNNHNLKLVGKSVAQEKVYWNFIKRAITLRPLLYYAYFPSPFTVIKSAFELKRDESVVRKVHFPQQSLECMDNLQSALRESGGAVTPDSLRNVTCGYPDNSLIKLTMPVDRVHEDLQRALKFLDVGFMVTHAEVDELIKLYMPRLMEMGSVATPEQILIMQRDTVCEALKTDSVSTSRLLASATRMPQVKQSTPVELHQVTRFLILFVSAIGFLVVATLPIDAFPTQRLRQVIRWWEGYRTIPCITICMVLLYIGMYHKTGLELNMRHPRNWRGVDIGMRIVLGTLIANLVYRGITVLSDLFTSRVVAQSSSKYDYVLPMMQVVCKTVLAIVWFLWVLTMLGASTTWMLTTLSALILVIAFTLNDSIRNIISSVILISEGNMKVGDWITIGDQDGIVEEFSYRCTALRGFDQKLHVVPNALVLASVINNSFRAPYMRIDADVLVDPETDPATLNAFLAKAQTNLLRMEDISAMVVCAVTKFTELGYQVSIACLTVHAPANSHYKKSPPWDWYQPYNQTRTRVATEVGQLLKEFAIDVAGRKINLDSSPGQSIAMCTVDPSVRNQKVETLRQVNETAKHQSTQAQSVLSNLKVYTGVMGPLIYPPSQQSLQSWLAPAFHEVLPDVIAVALTQCTYSPETRSNLKLRLALDDNSNDVTHLNAVSLLVAILDRNYTLLSESRGGETSLVVFVRNELVDNARVLGKAATDRVVAINGAACLVISLGGIEVSIIAMGTKAELIRNEDDFPDVLCEVIDRLELKPVVLSGADVLHAAPNVIFMGSMARQTDVFSDPNQQNVHLAHAREALIRQIEQGDCLSGFEFITLPNISTTMFLDEEDSKSASPAPHAGKAHAAIQIEANKDMNTLKEPVSVVAPQMHAILYSSRCGHIKSTQELEMEAQTAKLLKDRGLGNPVAATINIRGASTQAAKVKNSVQGLLILKIEWMEGESLMAGDQEGTSDPYVVFDSKALFRKGGSSKFGLVPRFDAKKFQTSVKMRTLNPKWAGKDCPELPTALSDLKGLRAHELVLICYDKDTLSFDDLLGQLRLPLKGLPSFVFDEPLLLGGRHMGRLKGKIVVNMQTKSEALGSVLELHKDRKKRKPTWLGNPSALLASKFFQGSTRLIKPAKPQIGDIEKGKTVSGQACQSKESKNNASKGNRVFVEEDITSPSNNDK